MKFKVKIYEPTKATGDSIGWDVRTPVAFELNPGEMFTCPLGISWEPPSGIHAIMKEKSGLARRGLEVHGGVIDSDYRGEWMVILKNGGTELLKFAIGDKIAQFILIMEVKVDGSELSTTQRGEGGFGSTGR